MQINKSKYKKFDIFMLKKKRLNHILEIIILVNRIDKKIALEKYL